MELTNTLPCAPSCERNQGPILDQLNHLWPTGGHLLELGSGTGQHAAFITQHRPDILWQTTEIAENLPITQQWFKASSQTNFLEPKLLDIDRLPWSYQPSFDAVYAANVVHFIAWTSVVNLLRGAYETLKPGGWLFFYGPYRYDQTFTSQGDAELDDWLKSQNALAGIKNIEEVHQAASHQGFEFINDLPMPANNRFLVFQKT